LAWPLLAVVVLASGCDTPQERAAGHLETAGKLFEAGDLPRAKVELRNTLQIDPRSARALYLMALINERDEEYPAVLGNLQMAVEADPKYVDARVKLGNYYALGRKAPEAREQADAAMALAPNSPSVRLLNAWAFYVAGERDKARDEARNALRLDPKRRDGITLLASLYAEEGRFPEALAAVDEGIKAVTEDDAEALRRVRVTLLLQAGDPGKAEQELRVLAGTYPESTAYDVALAKLLVSQNRIAEAEERVRLLIARDPDNAAWRVQLAGLLVSQTRMADAEDALRQAVRDNPGSDAMRFALAGFYETNQRPADALAIYRSMAVAKPSTAESLAARNRVVALTAATDQEKARALLREILAEVPTNVDALIFRAAFSLQDGKPGEAVADLRSALVRQPDSQRALLLLARTYVRSGDAALAEDAYRRLLAVNPASGPARRELAAVVGGRGDLKEAEELLREALELAPADGASSGELVAALMGRGDFAGAEAEARRIVDLDLGPGSALANYQLGLALQMQKNEGEAIAAYKQALKLSPLADQPLADLVLLLNRTGRTAEAEAYLAAHLKANPGHVTARILQAVVYRDSGRPDEARKALRDIVAARPDAVGAYIALAGLYPQDSTARLAVLVEAHERNPADPQVGLALGAAHERRLAPEDAIRVYETVLGAGASNDFIVNNLAVLLLDTRSDKASHARALQLAKGFADRASHPFNLAVLGWAHFRNGDYGSATRYLERAVEASPDVSPQLRYYLGMAYLKSGNTAGARRELQQAVDAAAATGASFTGLDEARSTLGSLKAQPG
jgi:tetratricopeptide (TPR) repeat protein